LDEGDISVSIESFAFTSNNVTYGVAGKHNRILAILSSIREDANNDWGCIPVWGFAKVAISKNVEEYQLLEERLFGYTFLQRISLNLKSY
jgi:hypothetical protein